MEKELEMFVQAAESLEELKRQMQRQQGSSEVLRALTGSVGSVATQLSEIPNGLKLVVERADSTEQRLQTAASKVQDLLADVPRIVERMETSDYGRSVGRLLDDIQLARADLEQMRFGVAAIQTAATAVSEAADRAAQGVSEKVQQLAAAQADALSEIGAIRTLVKNELGRLVELVQTSATKSELATAATATAYSQVTSSLKANAERQAVALQQVLSTMETLRVTDVVALRAQVTDVQQKLDAQARAISAIATKKGFLFG